jgi:lipoprotein-anchoring transpeptidase ErfK/SrfK
MAKIIRHKKTIKRSNNYFSKIALHHLRIISFSLFIGILVFFAGKYFFKPPVPCANSTSCQSDLIEKIENGAIGFFEGHKINAPDISLVSDTTSQSVLGVNIPDPQKHIYVDLSSQTLYAYDGNTKFMQTPISSGRWNKTPVGNFHIWSKIRSTKMSGGSGADYYYLPNVPYVMYFYHDFGLHGAYWHNNFGYTMSHGCVNMRQIDAGALFDWADEPIKGQKGTAVSICNQFTEPDICIQQNPLQS